MSDPTLTEMQAVLGAYGDAMEADDFDRAQAIYWFCVDWHGGQWSNLYSAMCQLGYTPSMCESGCEEGSMAAELYDVLERQYCDV
jgi:hypothetical protein